MLVTIPDFSYINGMASVSDTVTLGFGIVIFLLPHLKFRQNLTLPVLQSKNCCTIPVTALRY